MDLQTLYQLAVVVLIAVIGWQFRMLLHDRRANQEFQRETLQRMDAIQRESTQRMDAIQRETHQRMDAIAADLREEMRRGFEDARMDTQNLREEMKEGFAELRGEMKEGFAELRGEMKEGFAEQDSKIDKVDDKVEDTRKQVSGIAERAAWIGGRIGEPSPYRLAAD